MIFQVVSPCIRGFKDQEQEPAIDRGGFPVYTGVQGLISGERSTANRFPRVYGGSRIRKTQRFARGLVSPCIRGFKQEGEAFRPRPNGFPVYTGVQGSCSQWLQM